MDIEARLNKFKQVAGFQCPAEFWPALGYTESARYVAIWWERAGDEASWSDGQTSFVGADWSSYLTLFRYNFPLGHDARWQTGGSEEEATRWLVIDRETERAWLMRPGEAQLVLQMQWPTVKDMARSVSWADTEREMVESQARYEALVGALAGREGAGRR